MTNEVESFELVKDKHNVWCWKTKYGELIPISQMADSHLRNAALFLMGLGYQKCVANDEVRVVWLKIFRTEWERRMLIYDAQKTGLVKR